MPFTSVAGPTHAIAHVQANHPALKEVTNEENKFRADLMIGWRV